MLRKYIFILILLIWIFPAAADNMTLDGMTGGMSSDAKDLLFEILTWVTAIALIGCAIRAVSGHIRDNPEHAKQGIKGFVYIVAVILLFYAASFAVAYLTNRYG